jgi:GT2 family glycosyltransferase
MSPLQTAPPRLSIVRASRLGITACVCTRDRSELLARALRSLLAQTRPADDILVVDNAPRTDAAERLVREEFPTARYVREPVAGLDVARNRALADSTRQVVAFLDDDAVAAPDWLAHTERVFLESERIAVCTGRVDALSLDEAGQRLFEENGGFARGDVRVHLPADARRRALHGVRAPLIAWSISVGSGCSMAVRRDAALALGGFDDALDMGPPLAGGGDLDMLWRALESGYEVVYEPAVKARHEHRHERAEAIAQIVEHNRSLIAVLTKALARARGTHRLEVLAFLGWRLAKPGARLALRAAGRDPLPAPALLRLWWGCWRGLGAYGAATRTARARRQEAGR